MQRNKRKEEKNKQKEQIKRDEEYSEKYCWKKDVVDHCCGCRGSFIHQKFVNDDPDTSETDSSDEED